MERPRGLNISEAGPAQGFNRRIPNDTDSRGRRTDRLAYPCPAKLAVYGGLGQLPIGDYRPCAGDIAGRTFDGA